MFEVAHVGAHDDRPARGPAIGVQTTFRQIGAALGLAAFVAIAGGSRLATKGDFDGSWLFMAIASAGAGLVLTPLFRTLPAPVAVEGPANGTPHNAGEP